VEAITRCPLQWFLRRRAGVESSGSSSQGFGVLMHALAEHVVQTGSADLPELQAKADEVWADLDWEAPWYAARERAVAQEVMRRFTTRGRNTESPNDPGLLARIAPPSAGRCSSPSTRTRKKKRRTGVRIAFSTQ
jgi:hypothetical protein